jgi:thiol-disulfide isomerase/thioredoxin
MSYRKAAGVLLVAIGVFVAVFGTGGPTMSGRDVVPAPEFTEVSEWINTKPLKMADLKGKVVVVHFWTNGCINCVHNYPHYVAWQEKYKGNADFINVGIHTPEFDSEKSIDRIKERMAKNKLTFPVAVDNAQANWKAWNNRYWPCVYVIDKAGHVRYHWEGELGDAGFKKVTGWIDDFLKEPAPPAAKK